MSHGGVWIGSIDGADDDDALISPVQATVMNALRRAVSIALAVAENYAETSGLGDLKRANLESALAANRKAEFSELLAAEALITLYVFGNAIRLLHGFFNQRHQLSNMISRSEFRNNTAIISMKFYLAI